MKLTAAGLDEDRIVALDGDWSEFAPAAFFDRVTEVVNLPLGD